MNGNAGHSIPPLPDIIEYSTNNTKHEFQVTTPSIEWFNFPFFSGLNHPPHPTYKMPDDMVSLLVLFWNKTMAPCTKEPKRKRLHKLPQCLTLKELIQKDIMPYLLQLECGYYEPMV